MSNDAFDEPVTVVITTDGGTYLSDAIDNVDFTVDAAEEFFVGERSCWWVYTPLADGYLTVEASDSVDLGDGIPSVLILFQDAPTIGGLVYLTADNVGIGAGGSAVVASYVTGESTYRIRLATPTTATMQYVLRAVGPPTVLLIDIDIEVPTAEATLTLAPLTVRFPIRLDVPLHEATATGAAPRVGLRVVGVTAGADATAGTASVFARYHIQANSPVPGAVIPVSRPTFLITLTAPEVTVDGLLRLTITDATAHTVAVLTRPPLAVLGNVPTRIVVTEPFPPGTYTWAVDFFDGAIWYLNVIPARSFTIFAGEFGSATINGSFTVDPETATPPMLWFVNPDVGQPGDTVTVTAIGLPATGVRAYVAGTEADVTDVQAVAASAAAYTDDRVIDPDTGVADPEHRTVTLTVPDVPQPGGALYLTGD